MRFIYVFCVHRAHKRRSRHFQRAPPSFNARETSRTMIAFTVQYDLGRLNVGGAHALPVEFSGSCRATVARYTPAENFI